MIDAFMEQIYTQGWRLELVFWRDDERYEVHLNKANTIYFGFGNLDEAFEQAFAETGGSSVRSKPARTNLADLLGLSQPAKPIITRRLS